MCLNSARALRVSLSVTESDRSERQKLARSRSAPARAVLRVKVVLLSAEGKQTRTSPSSWRRPFRLAQLDERAGLITLQWSRSCVGAEIRTRIWRESSGMCGFNGAALVWERRSAKSPALEPEIRSHYKALQRGRSCVGAEI